MRPKRRQLLGAFLVVVTATACVCGALFTETGVFAIGHRYWMYRAARSTGEVELREHLGRVLAGTQYGVNLAENWVLEVEDRATRVRLWEALIELAPNEWWRERYRARSAAESPDAGANAESPRAHQTSLAARRAPPTGED